MSKGIVAFVDLLTDFTRGKIVLCNLVDGYGEGLFGEALVRDLMDWWSALFIWNLNNVPGFAATEEFLLGTLDEVLMSPPPGFRVGITRPDFRLQCRHVANSKRPQRYIHVINTAFFQERLLKESTRKRWAAEGRLALHREAGTPGPIRKSKLASDDFDSLYSLGRSGEAVFVSPAEGVSLIEGKANPANGARDLLGLVHKETGADMVALAFSSPSLPAGRFVRPTVTDAGSHRRFKTMPDNRTNRGNKTWGYAADLEKIDAGNAEVDGLRERVTRPLQFYELSDLEAIPLGKTTGDRGAIPRPVEEAGFADRLLAGRAIDDVKLQFLDIL